MNQAQHKLLCEYLSIDEVYTTNCVAMDMLKKNNDRLERILATLKCGIDEDTWCEYQHDRELYYP